MQNQFYNPTSTVSQADVERGFKKASTNPTFEENSQILSQFRKLPTYTYRTLDLKAGKQTQNLSENQTMEIKSPKSLTSYSAINFSQRPNSSADLYANIKSKEEQRMKVMYQGINFSGKKYESFTPQVQAPKKQAQSYVQPFFSKYSRAEGAEFTRTKSISDIGTAKQDPFTMATYSGLTFNHKLTSPKHQYKNATAYSENQQYKAKILRLQRELTQISIEKGELILQLAEVSRDNNDLRKQLNNLKQIQASSPTYLPKSSNSEKVQIDKDLLIEIQHISQQQKQINKVKEQYIQLASAGYQSEIKRLLQQNNTLKLEIQSLNFDLAIAKQDLSQKQLKIEFLLKETANIEQKSKGNTKAQSQMADKYNQIMTLKHSLSALQSKYKAQSKQLANKQDYILKYIVSRGGNQDLQAIQGLVSQYSPYMHKPFDDISEIQSQLQSNSQAYLGNIKNSKHI